MTVSSYQFQNPYSQQIQIGQPTPEMLKSQQESTNEALAQQQDASVQFSGIESKKNQLDLYGKSATMYQSDSSYEQTRNSVNTYQQTAQDLLKSQYIASYSENTGEQKNSAS